MQTGKGEHGFRSSPDRSASSSSNGHSSNHVAVGVVVSASSPPGSAGNSPRLRSSGRSLGRTMRDAKVRHGSPSFSRGGHNPRSTPTTFLQRLTILLLSLFYRRHRFLLLIPFVYVMGVMLYMGEKISLPYDLSPFRAVGEKRGAVYKSDLVFEHLWPEMEADTSSRGVSLLESLHSMANS